MKTAAYRVPTRVQNTLKLRAVRRYKDASHADIRIGMVIDMRVDRREWTGKVQRLGTKKVIIVIRDANGDRVTHVSTDRRAAK